MSKVHFFIIVIVIAVIGSSACKLWKEGEPLPPSIFGIVNLYDDDLNELDKDGMLVTLHGPNPEESITNLAGEYFFDNIPLVIDYVSFAKPGFGTYVYTDVTLDQPNQQIYLDLIPPLGQVSSTRVTLLEVYEDPNFIKISTTTEREANINNQRYLRYFFSADEGVGSANYEIYSDLIATTSAPFDYVLTSNELIEMGYISGKKVYVRVYGESLYSNNYIDGASGKMIFPNLNLTTQPPVSFIVP